MRKNNAKGKIIFGLILVVAFIVAYLGTRAIGKYAPIDISGYEQIVFFMLLLVIAGPSEILVGKFNGGRR